MLQRRDCSAFQNYCAKNVPAEHFKTARLRGDAVSLSDARFNHLVLMSDATTSTADGAAEGVNARPPEEPGNPRGVRHLMASVT